MGTPPADMPSGMDMAGWPDMLNGKVKTLATGEYRWFAYPAFGTVTKPRFGALAGSGVVSATRASTP